MKKSNKQIIKSLNTNSIILNFTDKGVFVQDKYKFTISKAIKLNTYTIIFPPHPQKI